MNLPRKNKEGESYLSYSSIKAWNELRGYNTGLSGKHESIMSYFFGQEFPDDKGFGIFGQEVETYVTERKSADKFTNEEKAVLETIQPLGVFQHEFKLPFDGFYIKGFIDDMSIDKTKIRDYKSCSRKSGEKYAADDYFQLDLYALAIEKEFGVLPEIEVCCIERSGNPFKGGGRDVLKVAGDVWYIQRKTDAERLKTLQEYIIKTAKEIEQYYIVFLKLNQ